MNGISIFFKNVDFFVEHPFKVVYFTFMYHHAQISDIYLIIFAVLTLKPHQYKSFFDLQIAAPPLFI